MSYSGRHKNAYPAERRGSPPCWLPVALGVALLASVPLAEADSEAHLTDPPRTELLGQTGLIPIKHSSGHITIQAKINGQGPFKFLLDTGASGEGRIDTSLVRLLGLKKIGERLNDDGTGMNIQNQDVVKIDSLQMGDVTFRNLSFIVGYYSHRSAPPRHRVKGILALDLFSDVLLTIDYPEKAVELSRGQLSSDSTAFVTRYSRGRQGLSCLIEVGLGPRKFWAGVDTGHQGSLTLPYDHLKGLRIYGRPVKVGYARTVNNEFELFGAVLVDPLLIAQHKVTSVNATFAREWGYPTIGYHILKRFALTFDQKNRLIRFRQN